MAKVKSVRLVETSLKSFLSVIRVLVSHRRSLSTFGLWVLPGELGFPSIKACSFCQPDRPDL